jgi:hypothetical protein
MRRRVGFAAALVLAVAALLPSAAAASGGLSYNVLLNYCSGNDVVYRVREFSAARTSTTQLTIASKAQLYYNGYWHNAYYWRTASYKFAPYTRDHSLTVTREYGSPNYYARIVAYLRWWSGSTLLAYQTVRSRSC